MLKKLILVFSAIMIFGANFSFAAKLLTVKSVSVSSSTNSTTQTNEEGTSGLGAASGAAAAWLLGSNPIGWGVLIYAGDKVEGNVRGKHATQSQTIDTKYIYYIRLSDGSIFVSYFKYEKGEKVDVSKIESKQWVKRG